MHTLKAPYHAPHRVAAKTAVRDASDWDAATKFTAFVLAAATGTVVSTAGWVMAGVVLGLFAHQV